MFPVKKAISADNYYYLSLKIFLSLNILKTFDI